MNIGILEPDNFSVNALNNLKKIGKVELFNNNIDKFLKNKHILFIRLNIAIDKSFIEKAPQLKILCSPTTGLNHIDLEHCNRRQIQIISLKGESKFLNTIRATPEHTLGLLLSLKRNYKTAFLNSKNHEWNRDLYRGDEIFNSKIGIIGLGRIGKILANYLITIGAETSYYDINPIKTHKNLKSHPSIIRLIKESDTIILCSNYNEAIGSVLNKKEINAMKGKYFINTARAELTDEKYLVEMSAKGHFKGIAIDVIQNEQKGQTQLKKWLEATEKYNVIITPHIGGATYTSMHRTEIFIADKLFKLLESK